ncbi:hypothetical protein [Peptostreptococcus anaerobius]
MVTKKYKFFKFILFTAFFFLCIVYIYNIYTLISDTYNGMYTNIISNIHEVIIMSIFLVNFFLFFKLILDIEKNTFLLNTRKKYSSISKIFLFGAIVEFLYTNISLDKTGIGIVGIDVNLLFIFFIYNYIIFKIIPYLIKVSADLYDENKSII